MAIPFFKQVTSILFYISLIFAVTCNLYYQFIYNNRFVVTTIDKFGGDDEWLQPEKFTGTKKPILCVNTTMMNTSNFLNMNNEAVLNQSFVLDFITEVDSGQSLATQMSQQDIQIVSSKDEPCVRQGGNTLGSVYAFCDKLPVDKAPEWAKDFEGIMIQTVYISTVQDYIKRHVNPMLGAFEGFKNTRDTYYEYPTISKMYCTTSNLARKGESKSRALYTAEYGLLKSVDCSKSGDRSYFGCFQIKDSSRHLLVDDAYIDQLNLFVHEPTGQEYIMQPWSEKIKLGFYTDHLAQWPVDDCLYLREGDEGRLRIGWFGLGYSDYVITLSATAAFAKFQLLLLAFITWFVDTRRSKYSVFHLYDPLTKITRLGVFHIITAQVIYSSWNEIDIFRTIYALDFSTTREYIFFNYLLFSVGLMVSLCSFSVVRFFGGTWQNRFGNVFCFANLYLSIVVIHVVGTSAYSTYTVENGMQYVSGEECPSGYSTCSSRTAVNRLLVVMALAFIPLTIEFAKHFSLISKKWNMIIAASKIEKDLTSFEEYCLGGLRIENVVPDAAAHTIMVKGTGNTSRKCIPGELVGVCGFTIIHGRYIVRTRDLYLLLGAKLVSKAFPESLTQSIIVWKTESQNGILVVTGIRRGYLCFLGSEKFAGIDTGILTGDIRPIA